MFGGYRYWTGEYQVVVDSQAPQKFPGYTGGAEQFQYLLYAGGDLAYGQHQIRITNTGGNESQSVLDIDYVGFASYSR